MPDRETFLARFLAGEVVNPRKEIYDTIHEWHVSDSGLPLHEWLGMTWEQYRHWGKDPDGFFETMRGR